MTFTKQNMKVSHSNVFFRGQELDHCVFKYVCLIYKVLNNLALPPLHVFFQKLASGGSHRASAKGDCMIPFRHTNFGQNTLSIIGGKLWNNLPLSIRVTSVLHLTFQNSL